MQWLCWPFLVFHYKIRWRLCPYVIPSAEDCPQVPCGWPNGRTLFCYCISSTQRLTTADRSSAPDWKTVFWSEATCPTLIWENVLKGRTNRNYLVLSHCSPYLGFAPFLGSAPCCKNPKCTFRRVQSATGALQWDSPT